MIWGCAPPILSAATFAQLLRLDAELATVVMVLATVALPLTLPPLALWLVDLEVAVSPWQFAGRVGFYLGVPFAVAWGIRRVAGPRRLAAADGRLYVSTRRGMVFCFGRK